MAMKNPLLALMLVGGIFFTNEALAREGTSLGISPAVFEITANPGDTVENVLRVNNPTESVIDVKMTVEDIKTSGDEGEVIVAAPGSETYSISNWVKCDPENFQLNPGEEKTINFTINVPQNVEPGGHYGGIVAGPSAVASPNKTGTAVVIRLTSVILVTIPGEMKEEISVKEFYSQSRDKKQDQEAYVNTNFFQYAPIGFAAKFENKGTVHLKPGATITVTNWFGQKVAQVPFPSQNVLPGATRIIHTEWNKDAGFLFGMYTATLTGGFGTYNTPLTSKSITFWVLPAREILIGLAVIIFFVLTRKRWGAAFKIIFTGKH